ncbi:PREDICTED: boLa class II histocompatibility antigen, DQB*0101 beta chain-like [Bison bison bison]|uniref:BoLa class II histocompatibility antigen, DQB*0101 beta chain-like n=1 Tax=Bison bison bison TaxID=43346 RepID=A0A6P3HLJ9_BISBB|nr:PREDICTED: boLa class II histocompatibility antigen, DQB*0101 beta chain-like [Bison bison bison]
MSGMVALWIPRGLWTAVVMVTLVMLSTPGAEGRDSPKDFVYQFKGLCYFTNGTERVRSVNRYIYNQEEYVRFDSDWDEYRARAQSESAQSKMLSGIGGFVLGLIFLGLGLIVHHRSQKGMTPARGRCAVQSHISLCLFLPVPPSVEPTVTIFLSRTEALNHHNLLVCSVTDFYPGQIKVRWFRNDWEETAGVVSTPLIRNGDWTFQILVMLEMTPQRGDVYTCRVEHPSLQSPIMVEWRAQSESAQSKMLSGVGGFVLGLIFLGLGLIIRHRSQKGKELWGNGEDFDWDPLLREALDVVLFPDPDIKEVKVVAGRNKQPRETLKSYFTD